MANKNKKSPVKGVRSQRSKKVPKQTMVQKKEQQKGVLFSIRAKIFLCFLVPILFLILVGVFSYKKAAAGMYDTFRDSNEQTINMANQYLDVSNSFIEAEALKYAFQSDLGKYMIGLYETDAVQRKTVINSVGSSIRASQAGNDFISNIHIVTEEDVQMLSTKAGGTVMGIYKDYKNEMLGYSDNGKKIPEWVDYHNTLDDTLGLKQSDYIMAYQTTPQSGKGFIVIDVKASAIQQFLDSLDMGDGSIIGFAVLNVNEKVFSDLYTNLSSDDGMQIMILDFDGNIISASGEESDCAEIQNEKLINWIRDNKTGSRCFYYNDQNYLINVCYIERFDWYLISLHPLNILLRDSKLAAEISLALGGILMIIAFIFVSYQSKAITLPLRRLSQTVDEVANGNLNIYLAPYGMDEVGHLTMNFNNMVLKMKTLLNQTFFAEKKKREYEMQALQAQINPHFLYNTLESICSLLMLERNQDACDMIKNLANFYRAVLGKREIVLPFRKELEITRQYIAIQRVRYADNLTFTYEIDDRILDCPIIKLSLQPLVENAIYHGIKPNGKPGIISIEGGYVGDNIFVSVKDNGVGICKDQLMEIKDSIDKHHLRAGFGISSVNDRIKLHFGAEYGLNIYSTYGCGTEIRIILPSNHA